MKVSLLLCAGLMLGLAAYAEGAREAGHEATIIDVCKKKINGCLACEYCHAKC